MTLVDHARSELKAAGLFDEDSDYGGMLADATMRLIETFAAEGHSGFSAGMAVSLFEKLARFEPLGPLTGADDEWNEVGEDMGSVLMFQNRRCSHVFKDGDGSAWDSQGRVFREPDGVTYTSSDSRVPIQFPYTPTVEYMDVERSAD